MMMNIQEIILNQIQVSSFYLINNLEFYGYDYCSIFELYAILSDKNSKLAKISNPQIDQIFNKTLNYCERFNKVGFTDTSDNAANRALELRK